MSIILIMWNEWRIQDFNHGVTPTPKIYIIFQSFPKNCMKMNEFGHPRGRARIPGAPSSLYSPMEINLFSGNEIKFPK